MCSCRVTAHAPSFDVVLNLDPVPGHRQGEVDLALPVGAAHVVGHPHDGRRGDAGSAVSDRPCRCVHHSRFGLDEAELQHHAGVPELGAELGIGECHLEDAPDVLPDLVRIPESHGSHSLGRSPRLRA